MRVKSYKGRVFGAELTKAEKQAMDIEINRQLVERDKQYASDIDAMILYTLMSRYGWRKKRLREFWEAFNVEHKALREYYQMDDPGDNEWLAHRKLREIGVDVNQWYEETKNATVG
jgi:hypothetical protein